MTGLVESHVEEAALSWFERLGYVVADGQDIAPDAPTTERESYGDVVLVGRLRQAVERLNPTIPEGAREDAVRKVVRIDSPSLLANNRGFHKMLRDGVDVEYNRQDGSIAGDRVRLLSDDPPKNDWLVVNQFTVVEGHHNRRPDLVVFLNGLPIGVIELKNAVDENATIWDAWNQVQTYRQQIPSLFVFNEIAVISDGLNARIGSFTAEREWFKPWRTVEGATEAPATSLELETLIRGVFEKRRLLRFLQDYIAFDEDRDTGKVVKILAGYHQFHAVETGIEATIAAASEAGDRRCGVVWHTQGSGKSLTMTFYAGRIITHPAMENPTLVVLTDRNDLDDQLFGQFARCQELLRQTPVQSTSREQLQKLLQVASGGVVFTTIQKFFPEVKGGRYPTLSERRNIVVIADEAHRSQYDMIDGFARHMRDALPNASFIGFTGTPIELGDKNTRAVFGDYISIYDIQQAVRDGATVPIYYESRIAKLQLKESEVPHLDEDFEEVTEGEEEEKKEKLKSKWAALEALVGTPERVKLIAADLVAHFEKRLEAMDGKAMIVCMSRRICVEMYDALVALRPHWHGEDDTKGKLKVVMTGSAADPADWQGNIRSKSRRKDLADRFRDPSDHFQIVIVRDMWLTGFDAPCLHTMYLDKPMRGHGLMQAIARVNRVFRDKPGGLVVDYLGIADQLRHAMAVYTESGGKGETAIDTAEAIAAMLEKYDVCCDDAARVSTGRPGHRPIQQLGCRSCPRPKSTSCEPIRPTARRGSVGLSTTSRGPSRFVRRPTRRRGFETTCRSSRRSARRCAKTGGTGRSPDELDHAVRQLVSKAVTAGEEVIDVFTAAGLKRPDISILSDEFLAEVKQMPQRNLAVELLRKLLQGEIRTRRSKNVVQARSFAAMLEQSVRAYLNRAITTQQVIDELIRLAKDMQAANERGEKLGLNGDETAFYDALAANESAVQVLGNQELAMIARELVAKVKQNVTIDWTIKETVLLKI